MNNRCKNHALTHVHKVSNLAYANAHYDAITNL